MTTRPKPAAAEREIPEKAPRERMVLAAVSLLSERGLSGTSFSEVIERSQAPRGSIYHHFPRGKETLAGEAIALVGNYLLGILRAREATTPKQVVRKFVAAWRAVLVQSGCKAGCAIAAVANEQLDHPELGAQAAAVFVAWEKELEEALRAAGLLRAKAATAAPLILASVEGALILCRSRREISPLDAVERALESFVGG